MNVSDSLVCGNYVSKVFDSNTGTWWNCDDDDVNEVSDFPEGLYTRDIHKNNMNKKVMSGSKKYCLLFISEKATL